LRALYRQERGDCLAEFARIALRAGFFALFIEGSCIGGVLRDAVLLDCLEDLFEADGDCPN
jgi:hypothetical protein